VCSDRQRSLAGVSRYAHAEFCVANSLRDTTQFVDDVENIAAERDVDVIVPITEAALLALLPERERFPEVVMPFATAQKFVSISNKQAVLDAAARVGVAIPEQIVIDNAAANLDAETIRFPIVVKPVRSVAGEASARAQFSVVHAASRTELLSALSRIDSRAFPLLLQQRIVGPGVGVFFLLWEGECIAQFSHRRLREKPPSGGISVYRESIALDPSLAARSRALLDSFGWEGVAMIEYKVDAATGTPYLMEINGRFWGSLQLAIDAGVDFPRLLVEAATGESPATVTEYRTGVRSRWFWGDLDHLIARVRFDDTALALPPGAPTRAQAVRAFVRRSPGDVEEILRLDDPKPFLRETVQWFRSLGGA
jgi:biotin carboxylase